MRFAYTIAYVADVEATLAFYERAFGVKRRFLHESGAYGELETGATALAFADEKMAAGSASFRRNRKDDEAPGVEVGFVTDDVEKAYAHALSAGAVAVLGPTTKPWGQVVSYVRDLNGFLVEICTAVG